MATIFDAVSKAGERITELDVDLVGADDRAWLDDPDGDDDWRDELVVCGRASRQWTCVHYGWAA
jgi:hypothetical protein